MRLEALETIPYSLPFRELYATASGQLRERELVLVRARGEGLVGLGETASLSLRGGPGVREIAREIESVCWPAISDAGFDPGRIWSALARCRNRGASPQAIAGVDLALHDLAGQGERAAGLAAARRRRGRAGQVQRDPDGGEPRAPAGDGRALAGGRLRHLQAQGRPGGRRDSGRDGSRHRRTGRPNPGRRQRRLVRGRRGRAPERDGEARAGAGRAARRRPASRWPRSAAARACVSPPTRTW